MKRIVSLLVAVVLVSISAVSLAVGGAFNSFAMFAPFYNLCCEEDNIYPMNIDEKEVVSADIDAVVKVPSSDGAYFLLTVEGTQTKNPLKRVEFFVEQSDVEFDIEKAKDVVSILLYITEATDELEAGEKYMGKMGIGKKNKTDGTMSDKGATFEWLMNGEELSFYFSITRE